MINHSEIGLVNLRQTAFERNEQALPFSRGATTFDTKLGGSKETVMISVESSSSNSALITKPVAVRIEKSFLSTR